jgi:hypothetical protein
MDIIAERSLDGLTVEEYEQLQRAERVRLRALLANDLITQTAAWEWFQRMCEQEAQSLESVVLDTNQLLDQRQVDRFIGAAGVWRSIPKKIVRFRDEYNKLVIKANTQPTQGEAE